MEKKLE